MTKFEVEIEGMDEVQKLIKKIAKKAPEDLDILLNDAALKTQSVAVKSIKGGAKSGRVYMKGKNRNIRHQASAAGQAPASDTGNLIRNITVQRINALNYDVGSRKGADYGIHLEFGTRKMSPRPWLRPAATVAVKELGEALKKVRLDVR